MIITNDLVEAFLKCPTKCFLQSRGEVGTGNAYATWVRTKTKSSASKGPNVWWQGSRPIDVSSAHRPNPTLAGARTRVVISSLADGKALPHRRSRGATPNRRGRGRPRGRTPHGVAARLSLYKTAIALIAERGYEATTLRDVADQAGVSVGLLYRYVPSKRAVILALYDELSAKYASRAAEMKIGKWRDRFMFALSTSLQVLSPHRSTLAALVPVLIGDANEGLFTPATAFSRQRVHKVFHDAVVGRDRRASARGCGSIGSTPLSSTPGDYSVVAIRQEFAAAGDDLTHRLGKAGAPRLGADASATASLCNHGRRRQVVPGSTLRRFRAAEIKLRTLVLML